MDHCFPRHGPDLARYRLASTSPSSRVDGLPQPSFPLRRSPFAHLYRLRLHSSFASFSAGVACYLSHSLKPSSRASAISQAFLRGDGEYKYTFGSRGFFTVYGCTMQSPPGVQLFSPDGANDAYFLGNVSE